MAPGPFDFLKRLRVPGPGAPLASLPPGINPADARATASVEGVALPLELEALFAVTYGATLGEYRMLPVPEMLRSTRDLRATYGTAWREALLPICFLEGVGDYILLDLANEGAEGVAVIDGFHEVTPDQWVVIRYGLAKWLEELAANRFEAYWLTPGRNL